MNIVKAILLGTIGIFIGGTAFNLSEENRETLKKEYLQIVTLNYRNGKNDNEGVNLDLYEYSIADKKMNQIVELPVNPVYPVAYFDKSRNKVFFSDDKYNQNYDNLYEYDVSTKKIEQITFGKNIFNDMFVVNDKMYLTVAPQYCTVTKPAIFDMDTYEIEYLDMDDNDTWYTSFSYNNDTQKLLTVTNSDNEMRTEKVVADTHIRPKTIVSMDTNFENAKSLFQTEDYEICLTRQLDEARILMTYDEMMNDPKPRRLKLLNVDNGIVTDYNIPGIYEIYSFYPRLDKSGIFILGKNNEKISDLYYYDILNESVENVFKSGDLSDSHRSIVDFIYYIN